MRFLLAAVNAKYIHSNPAVYSLAAYAGDCIRDGELFVREYTINQMPSDILAAVFAEQPDAVAFSCYIWNWPVIQFLLKELPKILPDTLLFLGGPEVSFHSEKILEEYPQVNAVMIGEGEETFSELRKVLTETPGLFDCEKNPDAAAKRRKLLDVRLRSVKGLMLASGFTGMREPLPMDCVPFFYRKSDLYGEASLFKNRILYYESSRGCPYRCSYCLSSTDQAVRIRSFSQVREHLDCFLAAKVPQVKFIDRTFNANREHALSVWKYLQDHDNGITNFHFEIAAELLTEEALTVIRSMRPGLIQLEIGVQSTNAETLQAIHRKADIDHLRRTVAALRAPANVHIHLDLIAGLPFEDRNSFIRSFNDVFSMQPHELQLGFLKVLKGTETEERAAEYGIRYLEEPPYEVLSTKWISYEDVREFHRVEEMLDIYYNSCQFTNALPLLIEQFDSPYDFFLALSVWYERQGYFVQTPSRIGRYENLLGFAETVQNPDMNPEAFRESVRTALTLDYYLREKPRRMPPFVKQVPDTSGWDYEHRDPITGNASVRPVEESFCKVC